MQKKNIAKNPMIRAIFSEEVLHIDESKSNTVKKMRQIPITMKTSVTAQYEDIFSGSHISLSASWSWKSIQIFVKPSLVVPAKLLRTHDGVLIDDIAKELDNTNNIEEMVLFLSMIMDRNVFNVYYT